MNNVITASRMACTMSCLRKHFWCYEIGLRKVETALALRIGSAWARAMEARWNLAEYEQALAIAIPEGIELDNYSCATIAALLAGYYDHYGPIEDVGNLHPEVQFSYDIGDGFTAEGKMDGLGSMKDGRSVIIEGKTTGDSIEPSSDYWLRLNFNMQVCQYIISARELGWDVADVFYDVTRKPSIRPRSVDTLDSKGRKIVVDKDNVRIFNTVKVLTNPGRKKGEKAVFKNVVDKDSPRQGGSSKEGWEVKSHVETPDEFSDRLWRDTVARPYFYYVRKEIPVLDDQLREFIHQREAIKRLIISLRANEADMENGNRDPEAWPRNVSENTCNFCPYKSFCLQGIKVDINNPPAQFTIEPFNPELEKENEQHTSTEPEQNATAAS